MFRNIFSFLHFFIALACNSSVETFGITYVLYCTVVNIIDNYYTNAHEELHRHESDIGVEGR